MRGFKLSKLYMIGCVVALSAVAGSCGGETKSMTVTVTAEPGLPVHVTRMDKSDYIARANRLCRVSTADMRKRYTQLNQEKRSQRSARQIFAEATRNNFLPHMQFWFDDISYLGAPRGDKEEIEAMLEVLQLAVFSGEEHRITGSAELAAAFSSFTRLARQYGIDECLVSAQTFAPVSAG